MGDPKNRTYKNFIESYRHPVNFKYFASFKLQSIYNHSTKFPSLKSPRVKVRFIPKYAANGLHGVVGKFAYVVQNCRLLEHIFLWVFHWCWLWLLPLIQQSFEDCSGTHYPWEIPQIKIRRIQVPWMRCPLNFILPADQSPWNRSLSQARQLFDV